MMMVNLPQIKCGAKKYIESEILGEIGDWRKWVIGAFIDPYIDKLDALLNDQATRDLLVQRGMLNPDSGQIDVDRLREVFLEQARERGRVSVNVPMVGPYFIGDADVQKIYELIITS